MRRMTSAKKIVVDRIGQCVSKNDMEHTLY